MVTFLNRAEQLYVLVIKLFKKKKLCQAGIRTEMYSLHSVETSAFSTFLWNRFAHQKIQQAAIVKDHSSIYLDWVSIFIIILFFFFQLLAFTSSEQAKMSYS